MYLCNLYTNIRFEVTFVHFLIVHIYVACVSYHCPNLCFAVSGYSGFPPEGDDYAEHEDIYGNLKDLAL